MSIEKIDTDIPMPVRAPRKKLEMRLTEEETRVILPRMGVGHSIGGLEKRKAYAMHQWFSYHGKKAARQFDWETGLYRVWRIE